MPHVAGWLQQAAVALGVADPLAALGIELSAMDSQALAAALRNEHEAWGPTVKRVGITADA